MVKKIVLLAALVTLMLFASTGDCQQCDPVTGTCSLRESVRNLVQAPVQIAKEIAPAVRQIATAPVQVASSAYQEALASAQYRAANRIHGHSSLDTHRTSGVGLASSDETPVTCLGEGWSNYAVARGSDGWYATKFTGAANQCSGNVRSRIRIFRK